MNTSRSQRRLGARTTAVLLLSLISPGGLAACSVLDLNADKDPSAATTSAGQAVDATTPAGQAVEAGLAKHVKGDLEGASADYNTALKNDPNNVFALSNLGLIAQTQGDDKKAEARYQEVLKIDPNYQPGLFNLAIIRKAAGDTAEAERLYRRAIEVRPGDAGAHLNLGLLLRETGRKDQGDAEVSTALTLNPEFVDPASVTTRAG